MSRRVGIYPGTFDPITNGHTDIIRRALHVVDRLVIGVARNDGKGPLFSTDERVEIVRGEILHLGEPDAVERVEVRPFSSLLMSGMNARLNPRIETVFLMASDRFQFISSRFVKEIGALGGDVSHFVSPRVAARLLERFNGAQVQPRRRRG